MEFVAGGAKQYAMKMQHKKTGEMKYIIKVRGITLDTNNAKNFQFEKFKELIKQFVLLPHSEFKDYVMCIYNRFGPNSDSSIQTKNVMKKYAPHNQKSLICSTTYIAYPFGYK
jgi:hypothetical protein